MAKKEIYKIKMTIPKILCTISPKFFRISEADVLVGDTWFVRGWKLSL